MISWDRCGDSIIGIFSPRQIRWLRKHLTDYRDRVDRRLAGCHDDVVLATVFTNAADNFEFRLQRARQSITVLLDNLPAHGGVIKICGDPNRMTWVWTLQELRIAVSARLAGSSSNSSISVADTDAPAKLQSWLSGIIETLIKTGDLQLAPNGPNNDF